MQKKKKKCQNVKDYIKEKQASQVNEFKAFRYMGRLKSLGSLKSFIWSAPQLSRASSLFFSILNPLKVCSWEWLQWLTLWWPQHPLFTDVTGAILLKFGHSAYLSICCSHRWLGPKSPVHCLPGVTLRNFWEILTGASYKSLVKVKRSHSVVSDSLRPCGL